MDKISIAKVGKVNCGEKKQIIFCASITFGAAAPT